MKNEYVKSFPPIFVVGTGRCGSTVFHHMLAQHPALSVLTGILNRFPEKLALQRAITDSWDWPVIGALIQKRLKPSEAWQFWEHHAPGFSTPCRDLTAEDVTVKLKQNLTQLFEQLHGSSQRCLLIKLTGWTRVGFIKEVFPEAKIIHIVRDPHPVVNSWINVHWWRGWQGPTQWRWGSLKDIEQQLWERHDKSFLVLAAIAWCKIMKSYKLSLKQLNVQARRDVLEIHYKTLCESKEETINEVLSFCGLDTHRAFSNALKKYTLENRDFKWKENFSPAQQAQLEDALETLAWYSLLP